MARAALGLAISLVATAASLVVVEFVTRWVFRDGGLWLAQQRQPDFEAIGPGCSTCT